jgi:hypothetical protein
VAAYVDGFNFYHGLMAKGWGRYRWLDIVALVRRYVRGGNQLVAVKYFTTPQTHQPDKLGRQTNYLNALEARGGVQVILGAFETRRVQCKKCEQWYKRPQEKRTDVNVATHLVADSYEDVFDIAVLICADGDLVPAVEHIQQRHGREVILVDPPRRHSDELAEIADSHLHVPRSWLSTAQLPSPVELEKSRNRVKRYYRPAEWSA